MGVVIGYFLIFSLIIDFITIVAGMEEFTAKEIMTQIALYEVFLAGLCIASYLITGGK